MLLLEELYHIGLLADCIILPVQISAILEPIVKILDDVFINASMDYLLHRTSYSKEFFDGSSSEVLFQPSILNNRITTLSRFGCRQVPTPSLSSIVVQAANYECCSCFVFVVFWNTISSRGILGEKIT